MTSLRCHFDPDGWLQGPISITHLLTPNHGTGFGTGRGVVIHTEAGFEAGTVATFMNPANQVSAFFSIAQDGSCHQYVPVGKGLTAWSQAGGNEAWRGIEDEDGTHPSVPLTPAQITTFAQILEACSAFDGFPLQVTDDPVNGHGLILHSDGGQNWGGHLQCPGPVRAAQRPQIVALAMSIRQGPAVPVLRHWTAQGQLSLHDLAAAHLGTDAATVLALTARNSPGAVFAPALAKYVDMVFAADSTRCPAGVTWQYPGKAGQATSWVTEGGLSLNALAAQLATRPSAIIQVSADVAADGRLQVLAAAYIDGVFARSALDVPAGTVLTYPPA
jgi:N-acetylmuramoyl-L-alanine amidase